MTLRILPVRDYINRLKVTIQATGRLGFNAETAQALNLKEGTHIKFGTDDDTNKLYLVVGHDDDIEAFCVQKGGEYFYIPTSKFFISLGYEFRKNTIIFDLIRKKEFDDTLGGVVYELNKREKKRKGKENFDNEEQ